MFKIESCNNHTCKLNDACQTYVGNDKTENVVYYSPKTVFDAQCKPMTYCQHMIPHNIDYIIKQSKMNLESINIRHTNKISLKIFDIVDEFGGENKVKLMRELKTLVYNASNSRRKVS